jgi:hypothetical protein
VNTPPNNSLFSLAKRDIVLPEILTNKFTMLDNFIYVFHSILLLNTRRGLEAHVLPSLTRRVRSYRATLRPPFRSPSGRGTAPP